jgi:hypothetical protein
MTEASSGARTSTMQLIAVPALITLAITILRLVGELQGWSKVWFNPSAGGGLAPIGIVWLVFIFGPYFALKLDSAGEGPASVGRVALYGLLGIVVAVIGFFAAFAVSTPGTPLAQLVVIIASIVAIVIQMKAWPAMFKTLVAYGFAARIPVTIIMFFAIRGNWGTHYDGPPPGFPSDIGWFTKFILIGVIPQLVFWIAFTVIIGTLCGAGALAFARRCKQSPAEAGA